MNTYNVQCDFYSTQDAIDFLRGFVWCECETTEQNDLRGRFITDYEGVSLYYDNTCDYYYFTDDEVTK